MQSGFFKALRTEGANESLKGRDHPFDMRLPLTRRHTLLALVLALAPAALPAAQPAVAPALQSSLFHHLILAPTKEAAAKAPLKDEHTRILQADLLPLFNTPEFEQIVSKHFGKPLTMELVQALSSDMLAYARKRDRLSIGLEIPEQDASRGVLRLAVRTGTYGQLRFKGNKWYSEAQLRQLLGVKEGDEVLISKIDESVNWTNTNPFRRIQLEFTTDPKDASRTSALVKVTDRIPFRTTASYDNTGMAILGRDQYDAAVTYGNLWGMDHQVSYDFRTSNRPQVYQGHSMLYRAPLTRKDSVQLQLAYARVNAGFEAGHLQQSASNYVIRTNYTHPFEFSWGQLDTSVGVDLKRSSSDLLFRSELDYDFTKVQARTYDVAQLFLSATGISRDDYGAWLFGATIYGSPGGLSSLNKDSVFAVNRPGSQSSYAYGTFNLQRFFKLPYRMEFLAKSQFQAASGNLQGSEQLAIGGSATVRGYDERIYAGDEGAALTLELHSPPWQRQIPIGRGRAVIGNLQLTSFLDFAKVRYHQGYANDIKLPALASTGLGLQASVTNLLSLSMEYGWVLRGITRNVTVTTTDPDGTIHYIPGKASLPYGGRFILKASLIY